MAIPEAVGLAGAEILEACIAAAGEAAESMEEAAEIMEEAVEIMEEVGVGVHLVLF